jgi:HD-GYP domain-containing protein (c-di-GMP phosphodiesterase class II)
MSATSHVAGCGVEERRGLSRRSRFALAGDSALFPEWGRALRPTASSMSLLFNNAPETPDFTEAPPAPWWYANPQLARLVARAELADPSLRLHARDVAQLSFEIGTALYLPQRQLEMLAFAAAVHDIGKVNVPSRVLAKPGPLEPWERLAMQRHPTEGQRLLRPYVQSPDVLAIVRSHHERWDGTGYPDGLAAEHIPLGARIVAVADAFTAMVEPRPYRGALSRELARRELLEQAGTQFDPLCARAGFSVTGAHCAAATG